jgi:hypothetical protein
MHTSCLLRAAEIVFRPCSGWRALEPVLSRLAAFRTLLIIEQAR